MSNEGYLSQINMFGFNFAPPNWAVCNGATIAISENSALYSLLGTNYGGDDTSTFALPQLEGRLPIGRGSSQTYSYNVGSSGGLEYVTLTSEQMPAHTHDFCASSEIGDFLANKNGKNQLATENLTPIYSPPSDLVSLAPETVTSTGGNQAHYNVQPYLSILFCIATTGYYPPRN